MMNREPARPLSESGAEAPRKSIWKRLGGSLIHNWGWKALSLALAIGLWGVLISQDDALPRDKTIEGVRVAVSNAALLRSNGLIVVGGLEDVDTVSLRARVPQKNYPSASAAQYTARLDLSQIQEAGEQKVNITASASNASQYGTVQEIYGGEVTVQVEEYITRRRIPVEVRQTGEAPEGCYAGDIQRSADYVDVSGPRSVVEAAARCVVEYDRSALNPESSSNAVSLPFFFEDRQGNALDGGNLNVTITDQYTTIQRINVTQDVYYMAQVPVDVSATLVGQPAEGFAVSSVRVVPDVITLAGDEEAVAPFRAEGAALYPVEQLDISGRANTVTGYIALSVPGDLKYVSADSALIIVTIMPEEFVNASAAGGGESAP